MAGKIKARIIRLTRNTILFFLIIFSSSLDEALSGRDRTN